MKVGIFGGTFNPVHFGHLRAAEEVRERLDLDRIIFIPSGNPPLKTGDIAPAEHRFEMLRIAVRGNSFFELSDIECKKRGKSYTVATLRELHVIYPLTEFFFVLGIDAFLDIPHWWQPQQLMSMTDFVVMSRPGFTFDGLRESPYLREGEKISGNVGLSRNHTAIVTLASERRAILLEITPLGISSTQIRAFLRQGRSVKYLLPPSVQSYIITHKLYKAQASCMTGRR